MQCTDAATAHGMPWPLRRSPLQPPVRCQTGRFDAQSRACHCPDPSMSSPRLLLSTALLALSLTTATAQAAEPDRNTPAPMTAAQIIAAAPASAWRTPAPDNLLYLQLPGGPVVIELALQFAPVVAGVAVGTFLCWWSWGPAPALIHALVNAVAV